MGSNQSTDAGTNVTKRSYLIYSSCNANYWAVLALAALVIAGGFLLFHRRVYREISLAFGELGGNREGKSVEESC